MNCADMRKQFSGKALFVVCFSMKIYIKTKKYSRLRENDRNTIRPFKPIKTQKMVDINR